jgi:hypothetical protein
MMKEYFNIISVIIFCLNLVVYILFFNGIDLVPDEAAFPMMLSVSVIGVVLSWSGNKGILRNIGIFGHSFFLLFTVIIPLIVRIFIWNTP